VREHPWLAARGEGRSEAAPSELPGRVAALEENKQRLERRVSDLETTLQRVSTSTREDLAREASVRAAEDERVRDYFTRAGAGGLPLSAVVLLWVLVGMLMSWSAAGLVCLFRPILP
jgi:type VI protein secretion system component VasF